MEFPSRRERSPLARRIVRVVSVAALALLASCGGGDRVSQFVPGRILAFGDEASVVTPAGKKYTVNTLDANSALDCALNPIWVQYLAASHGLPFAECPGTATTIVSRNYAAAGANVAAVTAQIDAHLAGGSFGGTDLVTVFAGGHDIREQYALYNGSNLAALQTTLTARGQALAFAPLTSVAVVQSGNATVQAAWVKLPRPKVPGAAIMLRTMASASIRPIIRPSLTSGTRISSLNVLVSASSTAARPALAASSATPNAVCPRLGTVTTSTLPPSPATRLICTASAWLWADLHQPSVGAHRQIGFTADTRARNNPF